MEYGQKQKHGEGAHIAAVYNYKDANGKYLFSKIRIEGGDIEGKDFLQARINEVDDSYEYGLGGIAPTLYNLPTLLRAINDGYPVYYVEGEKDCLTLKKYHYTATTAGAVGGWKKDYARYFIGATVNILPDNDKPGETLAEQIAKDLKPYAFTVRLIYKISSLPKGDVTDFFEKEGGTLEEFQSRVHRDEVNIKPSQLAVSFSKVMDYIIVRNPLDDNDLFYGFDGGVYRRKNKAQIKSELRRFVPTTYQRDNQIAEAQRTLFELGAKIHSFDELDSDERYINFKKSMAVAAMLLAVVSNAGAQQQGDSLRLHMEDSTFTLRTVVVKADKVIKKSDGMTVIPQKGLLKLSTDGFDVIYGIMIPGLDVDRQRGSVTRLGQEVAVYINGEKASNAELRNIKPGSIVRIDYIDIPSGKFINDPISLNIITRSSTNGAYYAFDDTQYIGYMRNTFNATAQWNLEHSKVSLFAGNDLSDFGNAGSHEREEYGFPGRSVLRSTDILDNRYKNDNQYLQLNVTKSASTYNMGIKVSAVRDEDPFQVVSGKVTVDDSGDKASRFLSEARSSRSFYPEVNAFGNFVLGQGQMLSANVSFSYGDNRYNDDIQEEDYRSLSNVNEDIWELKNFLSYSKTVKSQKFSLVMKDNYTRSNARYTGSVDLGQRFYSNEGILQAGYMNNFSKSLMLNLQAGSSWLLYRLEGATKTSKLLPRASITLRYTPFEHHAFTLNANVGNSFPTLNTFNQVSLGKNPFLQHRGNAGQDITRIYNVGLAYNAYLKNLNYQLMLINNTYMHLAVPQFVIEDNVMVSTYTSNADLHQYLAVFFGTWNITSSLALKSELAYIHNDFNGYLDKSKNTWRMRIDATYTYKDMMINVYGKVKETRLENTGIEEEDFFRWGANAKYNLGRWILEVGVNNIFTPSNYLKSTYSDVNYGYARSTFNKMEQANAYLKVAWRLNIGKKVNPESNNSSRIYPSSIMK